MIFSSQLEKAYYEQSNSASLVSYSRLKRYLRSWIEPEEVLNDKKILEIGAGHALYSRMITELFAPKRVVALDLVPAQLAASWKENGCARVLSGGGDCFHLPFRSGSFDVVFGSLILHRFRELEEVLNEIYGVLLNEGLYIGIEPSLCNPMHLFRQFLSNHSPNEFLLSGGQILRAFARSGFQAEVRRLSPRFPFLRRLGLATCLGIWARKGE
jgi:ubiquinone/menaquinone biosynthesis C-methylase UbiE